MNHISKGFNTCARAYGFIKAIWAFVSKLDSIKMTDAPEIEPTRPSITAAPKL